MTTEMSVTKQVNQYLEAQASLDTLRFITCGSVDDGKSTLIGRMLFEAQLIFDDQVASLQNETKKMGTKVEKINFAHLVDGLDSEREQGITIDVAYRFLATNQRKFIIADTPGHEQYTRNMATGASTADVAVILIDASKGVLTQTRRHSMICSMLGIREVVVAINKMDLVNYNKDIFDRIVDDYKTFTAALQFKKLAAIPVSALHGGNIIRRSSHMNWYKGPTLLGFLETVDTRTSKVNRPLRFPVQWVNRPSSDFRGFAGTIASGKVSVGQEILVLPSGESASIKEIVLFEDCLKSADMGHAVTLTLDREIDVSRGDVIVAKDEPWELSDQFEANLVWMDKKPGYFGRSFWLKLGATLVDARITAIKHKINVNNFETMPAACLDFNNLLLVNFKTDRLITFDRYEECPPMGAFILIDRLTNHTVAAGMIKFSLRRADNLHWKQFEIDKMSRQQLNGHKSHVIWFTGLSGSGKSTIAEALEKALYARGVRTYLLDGDNVRHGLNSDLGFNDADRVENIRRVGEVAKLMVDAGVVVLASFISPFRAERDMARKLFDDSEFFEIFVDTPLEVAELRDPKGLYKKARRGEIPNFTGIGSPYEPPLMPDLCIDTTEQNVEQAVKQIIELLELES